jgi:hypothetical protein
MNSVAKVGQQFMEEMHDGRLSPVTVTRIAPKGLFYTRACTSDSVEYHYTNRQFANALKSGQWKAIEDKKD